MSSQDQNMTNRQRLEAAKIIKPGVSFTSEQEKAINSLTKEEVDAVISAKNKLEKAFPAIGPVSPIQHFQSD